jgi:hypothetical protein
MPGRKISGKPLRISGVPLTVLTPKRNATGSPVFIMMSTGGLKISSPRKPLWRLWKQQKTTIFSSDGAPVSDDLKTFGENLYDREQAFGYRMHTPLAGPKIHAHMPALNSQAFCKI